MERFRDKYRIQSARLLGWDYANPGYYFVTICVKNRECDFGRIEKGRMILSAAGEIINAEWLKTPEIRKNVILDEYQIMPNHLHGIIIITHRMDCRDTGHRVLHNDQTNANVVETRCTVSLQPQQPQQPQPQQQPQPDLLRPEQYIRMGFSSTYRNKFGPQRNNLSSIIGGFKSATKIKIRKFDSCFEWQNLFDDRVLRNSGELDSIRQYIKDNPQNWDDDEHNK
ncbi:MAG: transposase [Bacteroidia bacterium]|nr:transposase [Bacteroidia bacterium]